MKIKDRVTNCTKIISKQNFVSYNQGVWNREGKEKSSWNDDLSKKYWDASMNIHSWKLGCMSQTIFSRFPYSW